MGIRHLSRALRVMSSGKTFWNRGAMASMETGAANDLPEYSTPYLVLACQAWSGDGRRKKEKFEEQSNEQQKKKRNKKRLIRTTAVRKTLRERLTFCHLDFIRLFQVSSRFSIFLVKLSCWGKQETGRLRNDQTRQLSFPVQTSGAVSFFFLSFFSFC